MNHPFLQDLCAALVLSFGHFLWIGTLIAVVAAVVARRQATAANRYGVWLSGLIAMAASPFVTLVVLMAIPSVDAVPASTPAALVGESVDATTHGDAADEARRMDALVRPLPDGDRVDDGKQHRDVSEDGRTRASILQGGRAANGLTEQRSTATDTSQREPAWWRDYAPVVASLYLIGVALMGLRLAFGLWGGRRLRNQATLITERSLLDALQRQADALGMKLVPALAYCERVTVPTVLGILKPMVLLPVSLASGLAPDQIESVLAHELAHLRRCDHLVNLLQCVIESVLFFHPAVWWVSRRIRDEREHCCDDLVIACGAVPLDYAASLLRVAELSRETEQQRGPAHRRSFTAASLFATGDRPSTLRQRIARMLGDSSSPALRLSPRIVLVAICLPLIGLFATIQIGASNQQLLPSDENKSVGIESSSDIATPAADAAKADSKDTTAASTKPESYVTELSNGLKVELVGITKNTAPANEGWKPDGTSMGDVGYWPATTYISGNTIGTFTENGQHPEPNAGAIDLMFRFRGLKAQPSLSFELAANGGSYSHWPVKDPYELRVAAQRRGPSPPGSKWSIPDGEMRVGVTDEPWGRYVKISLEGKTLDPIQPNEWHASTYALIEVLGTQPHDRAPTGNTVVLRRPLTDADSPANNAGSPNLLHRYAFEFRAIDTEGKNHWADSWITSSIPNTKLKESQYGLMQSLPAGATLSHYEFRLRPYRHWVTFTGVSLEPGKASDVKMKVEVVQRSKSDDALLSKHAEELKRTVVGTVVSPKGKPVAGIEFLAFKGGEQLEQRFVSDDRGEVRVPKEWRESEHWLTLVAREGRERLGWFDFMIHGHSDSGQKAEDGSFRLVLLPMSRTIRGRVLDQSGQPLAQIPVRINQLDHEVNSTSVHWKYQKLGDEALVLGAVTNNDGQFELKLPANTFAWLGTSHPDWVESRIRVTKENDEVADTKLVRAAKVAGRVIDSRTGKPLAGITIAAQATKTEILESGGDEAKTDADGNYLIQGLRSGEYTIQLEKSPFKTLTAPAIAKAMLMPDETFPADFSLSVGKRLSGRVLDMDSGEPIPNCKVNYFGPARPSSDGLTTQTNKLGEFEFFVPPGRSSLDATAGRRFGNESTHQVDVPADGDPEPVVLKVGADTDSVPGRVKIFIGLPLDRKVSLHFQRAPLAEVLEHACQAAAVKLELDGDGLKSVGYTKNMAVTIDSDNVTLRDALTQVLKPFGKLSFTVDKNRVFVSTHEQIKAREKQAVEPPAPVAPPQLRVRHHDGTPATFNHVVQAGIGFPDAKFRPWMEHRDRDGLVPLAKLPVGKHWLVAAPEFATRTAFLLTMPPTQPMVEQRLLAAPAWSSAGKFSLEPTVAGKLAKDEEIVVTIRNSSNAAISIDENDLSLTMFSVNYRILSPTVIQPEAERPRRLNIAAGAEGELRINWLKWVQHGLWVSRVGEAINELWSVKYVPGKIQVRVEAGQSGAVPVFVTEPKSLLLAAGTSPPVGLEFLTPYPKLHGLSLDMTEPQFLEIVKQQELKTRKTADGEKVTHHIPLGDGHTVIVMFDKDGKCSGIQRVRGEDAEAKGEADTGLTAAELEKQIQLKGRELFFGRMELAQEFETLWPTKDQKSEKVTSKGTVRWLKKGGMTRIESDRMIPGTGTIELHPEQWTTGQDGERAYSWNRVAKSISYGALRPGAIAYAPNLFFWGRSAVAFPQPMFGPNPRITRATRDGREEIDVVMDVPETKRSVHYLGMAPDRGYLPSRIEARSPDRLESQIEFQDFFQPRPGVWAPKTIVWTAWSADNDANGKPIVVGRTKMTVTKLELGDDAKLQDEEFKLKLPDDVKVVEAANADQAVAERESVIKEVSDKAILFEDGSVITTDAATKYARLTDKGEVPAERKELKAGVRVRYELAPGRGATKVAILPDQRGGEEG